MRGLRATSLSLPGRSGLVAIVLAAAVACDGENLFDVGPGAPPAVEIQTPEPGTGVPTTDSILVEVSITPSGSSSRTRVESVTLDGVSFAGDVDLGTFAEIERFAPRTVTFEPPLEGATTVRRFLVPLGVEEATLAFIRAVAVDGRGNEARDSVEIQMGAPGVRFLSPVDGDRINPGGSFTIEFEATDVEGIASIAIETGEGLSVAELPIEETFSPAEDTVRFVRTATAPDGTGTIELRGSAVNRNGLQSDATPLRVEVTAAARDDEVAPELRVVYEPDGSPTDPSRVEASDVLRFTVTGADNSGGSGVVQVGVTTRAQPRNRDETPARVIPIDAESVSPPRSGTFSTTFEVPVSELAELGAPDDRTLDLTRAPDTVDLEIFAFMVDARGNCGAATLADELQSLECVTEDGNTVTVVDGQMDFFVGVPGQSVPLPAGGRVSDVVVDTVRRQLLVSNIVRGSVEVFDLREREFVDEVQVGSQPWGMVIDRATGNTLFVANSGGTNIERVDLVNLSDGEADRILTPNTVLWEVNESEDEDGGTVFSQPEFFDFSDRPQFIAQERNGHFVYSTRPTPAATDGTIRLALVGAGPETEVILFTRHARLVAANNTHAFANVDNVQVFDGVDGLNDAIQITDHPVGDPGTILTTPTTDANGNALTAAETLAEMFALVDAFNEGANAAAWDLESVGLSDTTFVAASGDGSIVAIGEGATGPFGRIIVYEAPIGPFDSPDEQVGTVSSVIDVVDLVGNAAERVLGVSLNEDGTFGVARGLFQVYFFTPSDLRLQGSEPIGEGGAGVALHPMHSGDPVNTDENVSFAFVPTGDRTIEIFDTRFFTRVGTAFIRETIVGAIRATLPFPDDNEGLSCPTVTVSGKEVVAVDAAEDDCTVLKLAGPTQDGGVVVVNVTVADLKRGGF